MRPRLSSRAVLADWWRQSVGQHGTLRTVRDLLRNLGGFVRESTPEQQRRRYGDAEYDWEYRVDTTSATVSWRERLLGKFTSPYQPTDPALFHQMLASVSADLEGFVFIDVGSGKGRTLLMAANYPFRRILGIELLPGLAAVAEANLEKHESEVQRCFAIQSVCADARDFAFPPEPTLLYLFNPLPKHALTTVLQNLAKSLESHPRRVYVIYHNPLLADVLQRTGILAQVLATPQYSLWTNQP